MLRSAMTMSPDRGGVFDVLLGLVRRGLGGRAGDGRQYISWIHHHDFVRAMFWLVERDDVEGAVNLAAPEPLPNADFMRALRRAWGARFGLPATGWMLEAGGLRHADRDRARGQEPPRGARPAARRWLRVPPSKLA